MKHINDPKPEILRIEEVVTKVKEGDIKLPKFQRPFVWNKEDVLKLLDSIYNGYPIGSILLWLSKEKLASERTIGDLKIDERPEEYPTNYLLDGQQRLSSLCGALYWNGTDRNSTWNICFDLDKEEFLYPDEDKWKIEYFRVNKILKTMDFINELKKYENEQQKDKYIENAEKLLKSIKDYKVAAVRIGDMSIDEVAPIFERINSTGRQLTIVDLMRAATWKDGFDLNNLIKDIRDSTEYKNFDDVDEQVILRNLAAANDIPIHNKESINKLRNIDSTVLKSKSKDVIEAYKTAVDFLYDNLNVKAYKNVPYGLQLTLIVEYFRINPKPNNIEVSKLKKWFWITSISRYFAGFNTAQLANDVQNFKKFAMRKIDDIDLGIKINYDNFLKDSFRLNKATSKTFSLVLANKIPLNLVNGTAINIEAALALNNKHEYHHIFPQAYLKLSGFSDDLINQHANICLLNSGFNKQISDKKPSVYFEELKTLLGTNLDKVLSSNFISKEAFEAGLKDDYQEFIKQRCLTIQKFIEELTSI